MSVRARFAPSPTGYLHVGSARTALFSWLYARHHKGTFILRIEDTDLERSTPQAVRAILEAMEWMGLDWDEGPIYQTHRFERYREVAEQLLKSGEAYYCHCSKERLETVREEQIAQKMKPRYDGHCRDLGLPFRENQSVIRFRNPEEGVVVVEDKVHGKTLFNNRELDDLVIVRSDGSPTYNFTVVVDDWDMQITHVIRGDDHLNNTPRQMNLFKALGAELPIFAHIPMILGPDGKRLSKRHGAVSVQHYRDQGILSHALLNYLVRLGWSHGDQEIFNIEEMIKLFDLEHINKAAASFNSEKLRWLNQHYLKADDANEHLEELRRQIQILEPNVVCSPESLAFVWKAQCERVKTLKEMAEQSLYFFQRPVISSELREEYLPSPTREYLKQLKEALQSVEDWRAVYIQEALKKTVTDLGLKFVDLAKPLRVVLTGSTVSPSIDLTAEGIGKAEVLARLDGIDAG